MERYQEKIRNPHERTTRNTPITTVEARNENEISAGYSLSQALTAEHADHHHTPISWGKVNAHTLGPLLDCYQETIDEKDDIIASYETELSKFTGKLKEIISENETLHRRLTENDVCSEKLVVDLENVKSELKHTKQQNDMLIKKCALKQDKVEEILKCYEQKGEALFFFLLGVRFIRAPQDISAKNSFTSQLFLQKMYHTLRPKILWLIV